MRKLVEILCLLTFWGSGLAQPCVVSITNPTDLQRQEVVGIDTAQLNFDTSHGVVVRDAFGIERPSQLTQNGELLIDVHVRPHSQTTFTIQPGQAAPFKPYVWGRYYPERADDISFENDRTGFRIYGPETQRRGEKSFGIDLWVKHSSELLVDSLYRLEFSRHQEIEALRKLSKLQEADSLVTLTSYHLDHGAGMDGYGVGATLGCGTPALMVGDSIYHPWCYETYEIVENGPLRFALRLDFAPVRIGKDKVTEHRLMVLDKGSNFCRMTVWYEGLSHPVSLAAGLTIRTADTESLLIADNYVCYADPTIDPARHNCQIFTALAFPDRSGIEDRYKRKTVDVTCYRPFPKPLGGNAGYALGIKGGYIGEPYSYYIGMAWSELDVRSLEEWHLRTQHFVQMQKVPLEVLVK